MSLGGNPITSPDPEVVEALRRRWLAETEEEKADSAGDDDGEPNAEGVLPGTGRGDDVVNQAGDDAAPSRPDPESDIETPPDSGRS